MCSSGPAQPAGTRGQGGSNLLAPHASGSLINSVSRDNTRQTANSTYQRREELQGEASRSPPSEMLLSSWLAMSLSLGSSISPFLAEIPARH